MLLKRIEQITLDEDKVHSGVIYPEFPQNVKYDCLLISGKLTAPLLLSLLVHVAREIQWQLGIALCFRWANLACFLIGLAKLPHAYATQNYTARRLPGNFRLDFASFSGQILKLAKLYAKTPSEF